MLLQATFILCALGWWTVVRGERSFSGALQAMRPPDDRDELVDSGPDATGTLQLQRVMDNIAMAFDESGSVTSSHFQTAKDFATAIINMETNPRNPALLKLRLGVVRFGTGATPVLSMTALKQLALQKVNQMVYGNAPATNIAAGLSLAGQLMQNYLGQKLILLWTDGRHNTAGDPVAVARQLKAQGTCIVVVAIGPSVDNEMLAQIQGCPPRPVPLPCIGPLCMLINTDFATIEQDVGAFANRVQSVVAAGTQCSAPK